jgi:predicted phage tail protein
MAKKDSNLGLARYLRRDRAERCEMSTKETRPGMMRTVVLHGALGARFGASFDLDVKSPVEAVRALIVQVKGFRQALREGHYRVLKAREHVSETLDLEEMKLRLGRAREIHIVPVIAGSASGWGKILAGVAIIGLAIAAPYALGLAGGLSATFGGISAIGFSGISFGTIAGLGAAVALGGVAQMLSPSPTLAGGSAAVDRRESFLFGSAENVTAQGVPVPIGFGEFVTGSVVISAGPSTEEIGTDPSVDSGVRIRALLAAGLLFGVPVTSGGGHALSFGHYRITFNNVFGHSTTTGASTTLTANHGSSDTLAMASASWGP